jgi:hypothetical protein
MEFVETDLEGRCRYQHHMNNSYDSAHTYRLHQDTLRWNLFAGYVALLVGVGGFSEKFAAAPELFGIAL